MMRDPHTVDRLLFAEWNGKERTLIFARFSRTVTTSSRSHTEKPSLHFANSLAVWCLENMNKLPDEQKRPFVQITSRCGAGDLGQRWIWKILPPPSTDHFLLVAANFPQPTTRPSFDHCRRAAEGSV
ncbi:hypothetical protein ZHAS_00018996 [Anopheles sinensis]|uniref:Uncharacterized protein n=1 Tax=Anopheles sinensis TaxID=74873 RepID=A0A084WL61_ANOSI|nr:hypothetical protein ZHAS_00018996 [Anopheles sinensis]